eukprot:TRINITY_DN682_c1_g1_i1.p1 TRINITY_DN682_c1_g1~~TRINITY_DN682_c1_g1_i1.p1  ORF type:complete len:1005 (+),score=227.88 TRINITY_DN682_c1_g1_i1:64-3015(+)
MSTPATKYMVEERVEPGSEVPASSARPPGGLDLHDLSKVTSDSLADDDVHSLKTPTGLGRQVIARDESDEDVAAAIGPLPGVPATHSVNGDSVPDIGDTTSDPGPRNGRPDIASPGRAPRETMRCDPRGDAELPPRIGGAGRNMSRAALPSAASIHSAATAVTTPRATTPRTQTSPPNGGLQPKSSIADKLSLLNAPQAPPQARIRARSPVRATSDGDTAPNGEDPRSQQEDDYNQDLWEAHQRVAQVIGSVSWLLPDSRFRRVWDCIQLVITSFVVLLYPLVLADAISFSPVWQACMWLVTLLYGMDVFVRIHTAIIVGDEVAEISTSEQRMLNVRRWGLADVLSTVPADLIAAAVGIDNAVLKPLLALRFVRLYHIRSLFTMSNCGAIDPAYVRFYFDVVPRLKFFAGCVCVLHILTCIKLSLADDGEETEDNKNDRRYDHCLFWIWNLLTTSPAQLTLNTYGQKVFCFCMMWCGVIFQGVVVGQVSVQLLKSSIHEQNKDKMRTTLDIVTHYSLPGPLQQEVLSFQWHALQSNLNFLSNAGSVLERLPALMRNEVNLYAKIAFVNSIQMFQSARHETRVRLASVLQGYQREPGENVITTGETGLNMYFILHGFCDVVIGGASVAVLKRGQFFGEVALLSDRPRTATVRTLTYCDFFILNRKDFAVICDDDHNFRRQIADAMREKLRGGLARGHSFMEREGTGGTGGEDALARVLSDMTQSTTTVSGSSDSDSSSRSSDKVDHRKRERLVANICAHMTREQRKESEALNSLLERSRKARKTRTAGSGHSRRSKGGREDSPSRRRGTDGGPRRSSRLPLSSIVTAKEIARRASRESVTDMRTPPQTPFAAPSADSRMGSPRERVALPVVGNRGALEAMTNDDKIVLLVDTVGSLHRSVDILREEFRESRRATSEAMNALSQQMGELESDMGVVQELTETVLEQQIKSQRSEAAPPQRRISHLGLGNGGDHGNHSFRAFVNLF